jgi:hypothetical protein
MISLRLLTECSIYIYTSLNRVWQTPVPLNLSPGEVWSDFDRSFPIMWSSSFLNFICLLEDFLHLTV